MNARWAYVKLQYPQVRRLIADADRSQEIQQSVLKEKLHLATDSQFGRDHGLTSIRSVSDFRKQIPITDFEYFRPYVDQLRSGNPYALLGPQSKLRMFALTSGTTDKPKHIPVTDHFVRGYKLGWKLWGLQTHADHMDLVSKDYVHLSSDWQQYQSESGVWCGSISGLAAETRPAIVRRPFVVPPQVGKISDWTNRQYTTLRLSIPSRRVGMIITANPLTLVSLAKLADERKESLLRDMYDGTLTPPVASDTAISPLLRRRIRRVSRQRCRELETLIHRTGHLLPREFWPDLSVVAVWMGGPVGAFIPEVRELYGNCAFRDHGLSASEGRMTIPLRDESNAGLLDYASNYYEFIPVEEFGGADPTILESHQLEPGRSYYILLTNCGGLFRYNIHDVVECVGYQGQTPLLTFLHKGAHCSNMTGEKLTEYQVAAAVRDSFSELNRTVETVMLAPVMGSPPGYVLYHEENLNNDGERLAKHIDLKLAHLNCEYEDRIATRRLLPIQPKALPPGSWQRLRDAKIALTGGSQEQYKHSFLGSPDETAGSSVESKP